MRFHNRVDAGRQLAGRLEHLRDQSPVILGLPRGGVPVAAEVARSLGAELDVIVVRKLGMPGQPELAMGAIGEDGARVDNEKIMTWVTAEQVAQVEAVERSELQRRVSTWRAGREAVAVSDRTAVIVDDGIATGATASVACQVARMHGASRVVLAVPVAPPEAVESLEEVADEVIVVAAPREFSAVGQFYSDFTPTSDDEVSRLLAAFHP